MKLTTGEVHAIHTAREALRMFTERRPMDLDEIRDCADELELLLLRLAYHGASADDEAP